jgi:hypothetical protein
MAKTENVSFGGVREARAQDVYSTAKNVLASVGGANAAKVTLHDLGLTTAELEALAHAAMSATAEDRVHQGKAVVTCQLREAGFNAGHFYGRIQLDPPGNLRFQPPGKHGEYRKEWNMFFDAHLNTVQVNVRKLKPEIRARLREILGPVASDLGWKLSFLK